MQMCTVFIILTLQIQKKSDHFLKLNALRSGADERISISFGRILESLFRGFFAFGNSAPRAAVACPRMSKIKIAGMAEISKPPTGGILLRNTFKYGSVTE